MKIVAIDNEGTQYELPDPDKIPGWIKEERDKRSMSLQAVAEKIDVRRQAVWSWEQGMSLPTVDNLAKLMTLFTDKLVEVKDADQMSSSLEDVESILGV